MKRLNDILSNITTIAVAHDANPVIHHIGYDSRAMKPGSMFFALRGLTHDGHSYIGQAVANGAIAVVCETLPDTTEKHVTYITVKNSRLSIAQAAAKYYDHPSTRIKLIGITGTNGKTTIATLLHQLFTGMGYKAGLISTIRYITGTDTFDASHTTPDAIRINALLHEMAAEGCTYCFMEVSSHAIKQHRIEGLVFTGGIFTNLTHDHLDYHTSFDDYRDTKKQFFDQLPEHAWALISGEDRNASYIVQNSEAKIFTYAVKGMAD
ncbi:MAG: Mur ligase family protein, partial [Bacteroidales bacterium]|nr:Mur ligase family protein [Bacteroidales bacterium]